MEVERGSKRRVRQSAEKLYADGQQIWDPRDRWNEYKRTQIEGFVRKHCETVLATSGRILDAGCGNFNHDWMPQDIVSSDKFLAQARGKKLSVVTDIERLPFKDQCFDLVICVASVINYVSAAEALLEFSRTVTRFGH